MLAAGLGLALLGVACPARARAAGDLAEVRACVTANAPARSTVQDIALHVERAGERHFDARFRLTWRRVGDDERRILMRFRAPDDLANAGLLVNTQAGRPPRVHVYLPHLGKARAITSRGDLEGFLGQANLGIAELERLVDPLGGRRLRLLEADASHAGRPAWVVEERAADGSDARYPRILTWIDRERCIPLRALFQDADAAVVKELDVAADEVDRIGGRWVPRSLVFHDRRSGADTVIDVEAVEIDTAISPALLTVRALSR